MSVPYFRDATAATLRFFLPRPMVRDFGVFTAVGPEFWHDDSDRADK
jgi:hypothetical protein